MSAEVWRIHTAVAGMPDRPTDEQLGAMHKVINGVSSHDRYNAEFRLTCSLQYDRSIDTEDIITFASRKIRTALYEIGQDRPDITEFELALTGKENR